MTDTNRTTPAPESATPFGGCPAWCTQTEHEADVVRLSDGSLYVDITHEGPIFSGPAGVDLLTMMTEDNGGSRRVSVDVSTDGHTGFKTPAELRQLAAFVEKAATWLEAAQQQ